MPVDPYTIAAAASLGASALESLFGPDPDELAQEATERNRALIRERWQEIQRVYGRRGEFFQDQMDILNPQLAFADTQNRQAASGGARAAQAALRRRLGAGGDVFSEALGVGARTAATDRQNTLRALATSEAMKAADREVQGRAGMLAGMPIGFDPAGTGIQSQRRAGLFAQVGTGLGYLAENRRADSMKRNDYLNDGRRVEDDLFGVRAA